MVDAPDAPDSPIPRPASRLKIASAWADITPERPVALAGVEGRTRGWHSVTTALEANALLLTAGDVRTLLISADLLYFGPLLVNTVQRCAARWGIAPEYVILAASHTHFAPATDRSKPALGVVDADYEALLQHRLTDLVRSVATAEPLPARLEVARVASDLSINRRRRWLMPTLTREGFKLGPSTVMAPAPAAPRDAYADVLRFVDEGDTVLCVAWKFACHPVCFPDSLSVCAEYPGHARTRLRQTLGRGVPVLFLQGFTGDVRPRLLGHRRWKDRLHMVRRGPGFGEVGMAQWAQWADAVAQLLCTGVTTAAVRRIGCAPVLSCVDVPMAQLIDAGLNPQAAEHPLRVQRMAFGAELELLFLAAEVCSPYLAAFGAGDSTLCAGYCGHVFGYLPSQQQALEGGYEGGGFRGLFGLAGQWQPGFERAVLDAVATLRAT